MYWGECGWSELSNRYSMESVFWEFLKAASGPMTFSIKRFDQINDLRNPLTVLTNRMPCPEIEACLVQFWARQVKAAMKIEDLGLFGAHFVVACVAFLTPSLRVCTLF